MLIILKVFSKTGEICSLGRLFSSFFEEALGDLNAVGKSKLFEICVKDYSTSFSMIGSKTSGPTSANRGIPTYYPSPK